MKPCQRCVAFQSVSPCRARRRVATANQPNQERALRVTPERSPRNVRSPESGASVVGQERVATNTELAQVARNAPLNRGSWSASRRRVMVDAMYAPAVA